MIKANPFIQHIPVLLMGSEAYEGTIATALENGVADDYLNKPFQSLLVLTKLRAVLQRTEARFQEGPHVVRVHDLIIHPGKRQVLVGRKAIDLPPLPFQLLYTLASDPGRTFSRDSLAYSLGYQRTPSSHNRIRLQMSVLRAQLGNAGGYIETVKNVGYYMVKDPNAGRPKPVLVTASPGG
jgi:two-component system phosphate regulon response regulator PhoB